MPRSVTEITGISGSGTWASQSQTSAVPGRVSVVILPPSPGRAGVGALEELQVGEDEAEVLGVDAALAALVGEAALGDGQRRLGEDVAHRRLPGGLQARRVGGDAGGGDRD